MLLISAGVITNVTNFSLSNYSIYPINGTASDAEPINLYPFAVVLPFTIIYAIVFVMGVIGNISTCIVIAKNKSMRTATNYYLFSLACSDMLLLLSGLPPEMYRIWSPDYYIFGQAFCIIQGLAAETSAYATVLTITAFTVERYIAICHPFLAHAWSKPSRAIKFIIAIWIVALGLAIPQAIQFGVVDEEQNGTIVRLCTIKNTFFDHAFEISTFVIFFVPMSLISILYVLIGVQLRRSTSIGSPRSKSTGNAPQEEFGRKSANRNTAAQKRVVKMLVAVVVAFFVCWAPFHAQRLLAVYLSTASTETQEMFSDLYLYLMYISGLLYFISTTVNPVLYHIMSKKFQKAFKDTFFEVCGCKQRTKGHYAAIRRIPPNMRDIPRSVSEGIANNPNFKKSRTDNYHPKFSDSRDSSFLSNSSKTTSLCERNKSTTGAQVGLQEEKKYFILPLKLSKMFSKKGSEGFNNSTISNSSLKDTDVTEFTHCDLVTNMIKINDDTK